MYEHREIAAPVRLALRRGRAPGDQSPALPRSGVAGRRVVARPRGRRHADGTGRTARRTTGRVAHRCRFPFALPEDGGEAWLTLRVTTAGEESWAPRGTEVCVPQVRLRAADPVAPVAPKGTPVEVDEDGLLVHPLLTAAPVLSLWRAPTDNDELGGMAARWRAWGLDALVRKVVAVRREGGERHRARRVRRPGRASCATSRCSRASGAACASRRRPNCRTGSTMWRGSAPSSRPSPGSMSWSGSDRAPGSPTRTGARARPWATTPFPWTSCSPPTCARRRAAGGTAYGTSRCRRRTPRA